MSKTSNSFVQSMDRLFSVLFPIAIILFFVAVCSILSFFMAETPEQALNQGYSSPMPENWGAGVFSHGSYYKWFTIEEQPILFGLSIFLFFAAWLLIITLALSRRKNKQYKRT
jgi:hypothetical protein